MTCDMYKSSSPHLTQFASQTDMSCYSANAPLLERGEDDELMFKFNDWEMRSLSVLNKKKEIQEI